MIGMHGSYLANKIYQFNNYRGAGIISYKQAEAEVVQSSSLVEVYVEVEVGVEAKVEVEVEVGVEVGVVVGVEDDEN